VVQISQGLETLIPDTTQASGFNPLPAARCLDL
jgi:hypothetical protein